MTWAHDEYRPTVAIDPTGKRIMFGYYSNSHDPTDEMLHRRARAGIMRTDASLALRPSFQLGPDTPPFVGVSEYDGLTADRATFYSTWADSREKDQFDNNQPDVRIARTATSGPVSPATSASRCTRCRIRSASSSRSTCGWR